MKILVILSALDALIAICKVTRPIIEEFVGGHSSFFDAASEVIEKVEAVKDGAEKLVHHIKEAKLTSGGMPSTMPGFDD